MCTSIRDCMGNTSVHHNIYATSRNRHPTLGGGSAKSNPDALIDFRNCVDYNWTGPTNFGGMKINVIANYYRPGPLSNPANLPMQMKDSNLDQARGFMAGNVFQDMPAVLSQDNFAAVLYTNSDPYVSTSRQHWQAAQEFPVGDCGIPTQTAQDAYETCLRYSGCSLMRDLPDERLIADIRARQGQLIDSQKDVGGWDPYAEEHRPANWDTDGDGIPDAWEASHGLDPHNPSDGELHYKSGYTNLEEYLNSLVPLPPLATKGDAGPVGLDAAERDVAAFKARLPKLAGNQLIAAFIPSAKVKQYGGYNYHYNYMVNNAIQVELASRDDDIIEVLQAHAHDATRIWEAVNGPGLTVGAILCAPELRKRHR